VISYDPPMANGISGGFGPRRFGPTSVDRSRQFGTLSFVSEPPLPLITASETDVSSASTDLELPEIAIGIVLLDFGDKTGEGQIVQAITPAWRNIIQRLRGDVGAFRDLTPRQLEELIAGGYREEGWEVTLTPRSGDGGIDVIAMRSDFGGIRVLDQAKLYAPGNDVPANDVRAMFGVLQRDSRASKAVISTTSDFAPGVYQEFEDVMPTRLQLRNGRQLQEWLTSAYGPR
jgi:restriction system protein